MLLDEKNFHTVHSKLSHMSSAPSYGYSIDSVRTQCKQGQLTHCTAATAHPVLHFPHISTAPLRFRSPLPLPHLCLAPDNASPPSSISMTSLPTSRRRFRRHATSFNPIRRPPTPPTPPYTASTSAPNLEHIPSLNVDYTTLDAEDPPVNFGRLASLALFGTYHTSPRDPRYRALAKFRVLTRQHGIDDISMSDCLRALRVFAAMVDRNAKKALKQRREEARPGDPVNSRDKGEALKKRRRSRVLCKDSYSDPPQESRQWYMADLDGILQAELDGRRRWSLPEPASLSMSMTATYKIERHVELADVSIGNSSLPSGVSTLDEYATSSVGLTEREMLAVRAEDVQLLYHMLRHAESIYGFPINMASAPKIALTKLTVPAIICRRTGLAHADLKLVSFAATAFLPAHYVAVDRQIRAVVVCVRGTANIVDSLTDVAATHDPFFVKGGDGEEVVAGYGHAGVLRSARNLFGKVRDATLEALMANEGFELMITGHSLGAATAAVLAMIMRDDPGFPRGIGFCFAPLPCLSFEIAEITKDFVITVVNGPDIVPRLSVAVLLPFIATARYVKDMSRKRKAMVGIGLRSMAVKWEELKRHNEDLVKELKKYHEGCRLYIPGKVFQLVQRNEVNRRDVVKHKLFRRTEVEVVAVSRTNFLEVRGREKGMFVSHAPHSYKAKLTLALKGLGSKALRVMNGGSMFRNLLAIPVARFLPDNAKKKEASWDEMLDRLVTDHSVVMPL